MTKAKDASSNFVETETLKGLSKGDAIFELRKSGLNDREANKYYNANLKGKRGSGLNAKFDELLIEGVEMSVEDIEAFIEENNGNKTSLKSFLVSRYNLAKAIRDNIA